jgi:hypothetical protein
MRAPPTKMPSRDLFTVAAHASTLGVKVHSGGDDC